MHVRSAAGATACILLAGLLSNAQMSAPHALPARVVSGDISLKGKISPGIAQDDQRLTLQEAIAAAQRNAKPGSSFTALREIVANADTRRVGDQALKEAQDHHIELYQDGVLTDLLRSGGFLLAETDPQTDNVVALHLVSLGSDGVPKDVYYGRPGVKLSDAQELAQDTTEFIERLYSTLPSEALSLEDKFYGGRFPECSPSEECAPFAVPHSLLKLGADPSEVQEVVALYGGLELSAFQYAVSMPTFAASPLAAMRAAGEEWDALEAEFLRNNHIDPKYDFDPENIRSKGQLRERIDMLRRLDQFLEDALKREATPALVKANIGVATIPLGIVGNTEGGHVLYNSGTASLFVIYWQRLATGGFAVRLISEAG